MSQLAKKLPSPEAVIVDRVRRGPSGECDIYGPGDLDDWRVIENLRLKKSWAVAHRVVDETAGISTRIHLDKFRRHWRMGCWHWTQDQRHVRDEETAAREAKRAGS